MFSVIVSSTGNAPVTQNVGAAPRSATFTLPTCTDYTVRVQALGNDNSPSSDPYEFGTDCG